MTRTVDDIVDIAVGVLITAIMLFMGVWCWRYLVTLYSQPVIEKTAPTVQFNGRAPEHVYTGEDCLLELVINDVYCPEPNKIQFTYNGSSRTVTYDASWFSNKEFRINTLWDEFFKDAVNATHVDFELVYKADGVTPDKWVATMTD